MLLDLGFLAQAARVGLDDDLLSPCPWPCPWPPTCRMPLASMSKATSTCGMPRGAGGMPCQVELAERSCCHRAPSRARPGSTWIVTAGLVVIGGGEARSRPWSGWWCSCLDELGHHAAERLDTERLSGVTSSSSTSLTVTGEHAVPAPRRPRPRPRQGSHPCAAPCRRCPSRMFCTLRHARHGRRPGSPRRTGRGLEAGILQRGTARAQWCASTRSSTSDFELGARQACTFRCFGSAGIGGDVGQVHIGLRMAGRQLDLGLLGRLPSGAASPARSRRDVDALTPSGIRRR